MQFVNEKPPRDKFHSAKKSVRAILNAEIIYIHKHFCIRFVQAVLIVRFEIFIPFIRLTGDDVGTPGASGSTQYAGE